MEFSSVISKRKQNKDESTNTSTSLVLFLQESFGCIQRHLNCNSFICGAQLLYLNGNFIVLHNIIQSGKKFIQRSQHEQNQIITALCCYSDAQNTIAIATISKKHTLLTVYNDHTDVVLTYFLPVDQQIIDIGFVSATQIIVLTNQSNLLLVRDPRFCPSKGQLQKFPLTSQPIRICEVRGNMVLLCGPDGVSQVFIIGQKVEIETVAKDLNAIGCIYYQNNVCLVLTSDSVICYKDNKPTFQFNLSDISNEGLKASCIIKFSRGFFIGHSNKLAVSMFLFENGVIRYANTYGLDEKVKGRIVSLHVSSDEMYIAATALIGDAQTTTGSEIPHGSYIENMLINLVSLSAERTLTSPFSRIFKNHLEYGPIQALRGTITAHCMSLVGSNIFDYTYQDSFKLLIKFNLSELIMDIAVHPLGFQLVCLLKDSLRVFYRLERDLIEIHKIPQICLYAQYSESGLLAVALVNANHHEILILETVKFQTIKAIQCFSSKHAINKILWKYDDSQLHVYAGNQEFYIINPESSQKLIEFYQRKKTVSCIHYQSQINQMFVSFTDGLFKVYTGKVDVGLFGKGQEYHLPWNITTICIIKKKTIVFGTSTGKIVWANWPFNYKSEQQELPQYEQVTLSSESISQLLLVNLKHLVVGTTNGALYILRLKRRKEHHLIDIESNHEWCKFKDIVMLSKSSLDQTKDKLKNLLEKRDSYMSELQEMKKEEENKYALEVKELALTTREQQRKNLGDILETIKKNKETKAAIEKEQDLLQKKKDMTTKDWEQHSDKEMLKIYRENERIAAKLAHVKSNIHEQYKAIQQQFQQNTRDIEEEFTMKLNRGQLIVKEMREKIYHDQLKRKLIKNQKVEQIKEFNMQKREKMVEQEHDLTGLNNDFKAKLSKLQREIDRFDIRKDFLQSKKKYLQKQISEEQAQKYSLQTIKDSLKVEILDLEDATNKREELIRDLAIRNEKLTGFRQVYTHLQQRVQKQNSTLKQYMTVLSDKIIKINSELVGILNQNRKCHELIKTHQSAKIQLVGIKQEQKTPLYRLSSIVNTSLNKLSQIRQNINKDWKPQAMQLLDGLHNQMSYLQTLSSNSRMISIKQNKILESMQQHNLEQVKNNLIEQKKYLQLNIKRFSGNQRLLEVDLTDLHVKMQAKNSNLITECNILKERLFKKQKCLKQQVNNVKTSENLLQNVERQYREVAKLVRPSTGRNLFEVFPVVPKETRKNSDAPHLRIKTQHKYTRQSTVSTDTKCETILNIRRLKTTKNELNHTRYIDDMFNETDHITSKPSTNHGSRTALGKSRGKLITRCITTSQSYRKKTRDTFDNSVGKMM